MKTLNFYAVIGALVLSIMLISCSKEEELKPTYSPDDVSEQLSTQEYTGLIDLLEQQKFHYDMYTAMYEKTSSNLFQKLFQDEKIVFDLISDKIEFYGERNPLELKIPGEYLSTEMKNLYTDFETVANAGLTEVLKFTICIEESTIDDIEAYMNVLSKRDISVLCIEMLNSTKVHIELLNNELRSRDVVIEPFNPIADF